MNDNITLPDDYDDMSIKKLIIKIVFLSIGYWLVENDG